MPVNRKIVSALKLLLARLCVLPALVRAVKEFSIEELYGYHSKDEMEEEIDNEDVEHILETVDDAVEDGLELGHALDGLQGPEDAQHAEGLHGGEILAAGAPSKKTRFLFC